MLIYEVLTNNTSNTIVEYKYEFRQVWTSYYNIRNKLGIRIGKLTVAISKNPMACLSCKGVIQPIAKYNVTNTMSRPMLSMVALDLTLSWQRYNTNVQSRVNRDMFLYDIVNPQLSSNLLIKVYTVMLFRHAIRGLWTGSIYCFYIFPSCLKK